MFDHDATRRRIRAKLTELNLPLTGKWLTEHGLGKTTLRNFLEMHKSITVATINKLAPALGVSPQWLMFGIDEEGQPDVGWLPDVDVLANLMAIAMHVEPEDRARLDDIRVYAGGVEAGLRRLARSPSKKGSPDYLEAVRQDVLDAVVAARPASSRRASRIR